ncbi:WD40 repeat domain-containing protein [Ktedonobacteria bacterium brp13]|nr:WD40 repeat domain-containing protein [Ktedonobacteria bacterium brp13]
MAFRQLMIEYTHPSLQRKACLQVTVDDRAAIGPWVATLAARVGYPLVDAFGAPLIYRLRSVSGAFLLTTGQFADARFPSGSHFILERERQTLLPRREQGEQGEQDQTSLAALWVSRRSLLGVLSACSVLGFGSGVTTAFAQHLLMHAREAIPPISLRTLFRDHQQTVRTLTWSPDGLRIASGGNDGMALVWNEEGRVLFRQQFPAPVSALAWSPDGMQLLAGTAHTVSFLNMQTGALLAENAKQHTAAITALGWTQGSSMEALSASADTTAVVWSAQSHQPLVIFRGHTSAIEALATCETTVVTASEGGLARTWSALSGQEIHGYYAQSQRPLRTVAFSSRGSLAIGGDEGVIYLWSDARTCQRQVPDVFGVHCLDEAIRLQEHTQPVRALAWSPDGTQLASGGDDHKLIIWSLRTMKPLLLQGQQDAIGALSWSSTGSLLVGALGAGVALWRLHL